MPQQSTLLFGRDSLANSLTAINMDPKSTGLWSCLLFLCCFLFLKHLFVDKTSITTKLFSATNYYINTMMFCLDILYFMFIECIFCLLLE